MFRLCRVRRWGVRSPYPVPGIGCWVSGIGSLRTGLNTQRQHTIGWSPEPWTGRDVHSAHPRIPRFHSLSRSPPSSRVPPQRTRRTRRGAGTHDRFPISDGGSREEGALPHKTKQPISASKAWSDGNHAGTLCALRALRGEFGWGGGSCPPCSGSAGLGHRTAGCRVREDIKPPHPGQVRDLWRRAGVPRSSFQSWRRT